LYTFKTTPSSIGGVGDTSAMTFWGKNVKRGRIKEENVKEMKKDNK
jgi:hypothetical protein